MSHLTPTAYSSAAAGGSLHLWVVMGLARLWQQQVSKKTRRMLAEIYGWFTEGFGTKDLQETKALLEELSYKS
jgi:hypothetical protein